MIRARKEKRCIYGNQMIQKLSCETVFQEELIKT